MSIVYPRRWEERTEEHAHATDEWDRVRREAGLPEYNGCGSMRSESIISAALRARWDGSMVLKAHTSDWASLPLEWRYEPPGFDQNGTRVLDYSRMLPESHRTLHVVADDRMPPGRALLLTPDGKELAVVRW